MDLGVFYMYSDNHIYSKTFLVCRSADVLPSASCWWLARHLLLPESVVSHGRWAKWCCHWPPDFWRCSSSLASCCRLAHAGTGSSLCHPGCRHCVPTVSIDQIVCDGRTTMRKHTSFNIRRSVCVHRSLSVTKLPRQVTEPGGQSTHTNTVLCPLRLMTILLCRRILKRGCDVWQPWYEFHLVYYRSSSSSIISSS